MMPTQSLQSSKSSSRGESAAPETSTLSVSSTLPFSATPSASSVPLQLLAPVGKTITSTASNSPKQSKSQRLVPTLLVDAPVSAPEELAPFLIDCKDCTFETQTGSIDSDDAENTQLELSIADQFVGIVVLPTGLLPEDTNQANFTITIIANVQRNNKIGSIIVDIVLTDSTGRLITELDEDVTICLPKEEGKKVSIILIEPSKS
ncbi:MAG: hypothetical protein NXI00_23190 [Cytophagales bacterium]|nr:hypothetical protein [Cytophagales bacterium]